MARVAVEARHGRGTAEGRRAGRTRVVEAPDPAGVGRIAGGAAPAVGAPGEAGRVDRLDLSVDDVVRTGLVDPLDELRHPPRASRGRWGGAVAAVAGIERAEPEPAKLTGSRAFPACPIRGALLAAAATLGEVRNADGRPARPAPVVTVTADVPAQATHQMYRGGPVTTGRVERGRCDGARVVHRDLEMHRTACTNGRGRAAKLTPRSCTSCCRSGLSH